MMTFQRYHIYTKPLEDKDSQRIGKFLVDRDSDLCINCATCAIVCIYDVHQRSSEDPRIMEKPHHWSCKGCFQCVMECPKGVLSLRSNPDFESLGNGYWRPEDVTTIWQEAKTGAIPVTGAGYGGPLGGTGFDSMFTDMSEIVRPTRDGIHGREYISTSVILGKGLKRIPLTSYSAKIHLGIEILLPIIFDAVSLRIQEESINLLLAKAARQLGILTILEAKYLPSVPRKDQNYVVPYFDINQPIEEVSSLLESVRAVEIENSSEFQDFAESIHSINKKTLILLKTGFTLALEEFSQQDLPWKDVDILHLVANDDGHVNTEQGSQFVMDATQQIHSELVRHEERENFCLVVGGGIAMAEHVPKIVIAGADCVTIDTALLVALGCKVCFDCSPYEDKCTLIPISGEEEVSWGTQRILNQLGAWHGQLLEILSAMGIREVRRLRGEMGRAMLLKDLEKDLLRPSIAGESFR